MKNQTKEKWYYFVCYFFVFCLIGWIYEYCWEVYNHAKEGNLSFGTIANMKLIGRGFLHGPYLPVYGFGGLLLISSLKKYINSPKNLITKILTPIGAFISIMVIVSTVEFIASLILENFFDVKLWDYSYDKFNIQGRVSLRNSTLLSIGGMFFIYILHPLLRKLFSKTNKKILIVSAFVIIAVMGGDLIYTIMK